MTSAMKTGPLKLRQRSETVEEYLAAVRPDARAALVNLMTRLVKARIVENRARGYR